jgi:dihydroorotate dehydrogenase (fumarate)
MLDAIQGLRAKFRDNEGATSRIGIELNTSCPNIKGSPPLAYYLPGLTPILDVLAQYFWRDPTLTIGLKLPPYTYSTQFDELVQTISAYSRPDPNDQSQQLNPFAFLTSTNTLGQTLFFAEQAATATATMPNSPLLGKDVVVPDDAENAAAVEAVATTPTGFALPTVLGGMAGEALHPLALGNVYTLRQLLNAHHDPSVRNISIIGVGGVTTRAAHVRMRRAGAAVVACATILVREGAGVFEKLSIVGDEWGKWVSGRGGGGSDARKGRDRDVVASDAEGCLELERNQKHISLGDQGS